MLKTFFLNYKTLLIILILGCFYAIRYTTFIDYYFNIDELVYLYLNQRAQVEPLPFEGYDTQTSGPISLLLLQLFQKIGFTINLINYRVIILLISSFILLKYVSKTLKNKYSLYIIGLTIGSLLYIYHLDFIAINTEYIIITIVAPMTYILFKDSPSRLNTFIYSCLLFLLFFTKFQAVLLVGVFTFLWGLKFSLLKDISRIKNLILYGLLLFILLLVIFYWLGILDDFLHNYILRNLEYPKLKQTPELTTTISDNAIIWSKYFSLYILLILMNDLYNQFKLTQVKNQSPQKNILRIIKTPNSLLRIIFILILITLIFQYKLGLNLIEYIPINILKTLGGVSLIGIILTSIYILKPLQFKVLFNRNNLVKKFKTIALFSITITIYLSIIAARYNFTHYFILCFVPVLLWIGFTLEKATKKQLVFSIIFISILVGFQKIENKQFEINFQENITNQKKLNIKFQHCLNKLHVKQKKESILILGFFEAVPMYYRASKHFTFCYRTANTQFITLFYQKGLNNQYFKKEDERLIDDIKKGKPYYIIDTEACIQKIQRSRSATYINQHYIKELSCEGYLVYMLKKR
jgi:hypothetical protein